MQPSIKGASPHSRPKGHVSDAQMPRSVRQRRACVVVEHAKSVAEPDRQHVGPGTVSVLDLAGRKTLTVIPVAGHVQRISLSPDGHWAFTSDTEKPRVAVIDTATNKVDRWITLPGTGYGTAPTLDGKWLLVAIASTNEVAVVEVATMRVVRTIKVPPSPQEVLVRPDGMVAYVSCSASHQIAAIQINDWSVKLIEAGRGSDGLAWAK
jgi:VCBS repeat-containing protein